MSEAVNHADRDHAFLSASGAKIWLTCPPSARFAEPYADPADTSEYAAEGTIAHELVELLFRVDRGGHDGADIAEIEDFNRAHKVTGEMWDAATTFVAYVTERFNAALATTPDAQLFTEQRFDYSKWVPEGFGTSDVVILADDLLEVIDFKYGQGVLVDATENPQMRLYAAGAWWFYSPLYNIRQVRTTVYQPRRDHIASETLPVEELVRWLEEYTAPRAQQAWAGTGEFTPGTHCQFCKGLPHCRALADRNLELARYEFQPANTLTTSEVADILERAELLTLWAKAVSEYALGQAVNNGIKYPGWMLVEGRSNSKYTDPDVVAKTLIAAGIPEAIIYERNLLGLTAMKSAIGSKQYKALVEPLLEKPSGKPKLDRETCGKPEFGSASAAKQDFENN